VSEFYLDLIYDGFYNGPKVLDFLGDDPCVCVQLQHKRHVPDSRRHDHEELLIIHAIGTLLVEPLVNQLADDLANALDRYLFKRCQKFDSVGGILEGS